MVAVLLAAGAGYGNYVLISAHDERVSVLVLARNVPWGHTVAESDLAVARAVTDPQVRMIPASDRASVVGQIAAMELAVGSFLTRQQLTSRTVPNRDEIVLGLLCKPGSLPARGVQPGDPVTVTPIPANQSTSTGPRFRARVVGVGASDSGGTVTVDVVVPLDRAGDATTAAAGPVIVSLLGPEN